jgi:hypothetical protein
MNTHAPPKETGALLHAPISKLAAGHYHSSGAAQGCCHSRTLSDRLPQAGNSNKASGTAISTTRRGHWWNPLDTEFNRGGFDYRQITREGRFAIYEQHWLSSPNPNVCYEVVRIRRHNGKNIGDHWIEPGEFYPSSSEWGEHGWTLLSLDAAFVKLRQLSGRRQ